MASEIARPPIPCRHHSQPRSPPPRLQGCSERYSRRRQASFCFSGKLARPHLRSPIDAHHSAPSEPGRSFLGESAPAFPEVLAVGGKVDHALGGGNIEATLTHGYSIQHEFRSRD